MSNIVNSKTLKFNQKYHVKECSEPETAPWGGDYYVLKVSEGELDETFELYSTPLLCKYIKNEKPTGKFNFIVKEKNGIKYPFIEGYSKERNWVVLE